jgi:hypothetical protein
MGSDCGPLRKTAKATWILLGGCCKIAIAIALKTTSAGVLSVDA